MKKNNIWVITPKTNLHVGNENTSSYGLIDLAIQRDAVTNLPCINSSSLKGAIKEYVTEVKKIEAKDSIKVFGSAKGNDNDTSKGKYNFFDAEIVAMPVPDDTQAYKLVACEDAIVRFVNKVNLFGANITKDDILNEIKPDSIKDMESFKILCDDNNLPIIAHNKLDNGESVNLWYEQVLPSEAVLLTAIDSNGDSLLEGMISKKIIQVGANATIGYGYCEFKHL